MSAIIRSLETFNEALDKQQTYLYPHLLQSAVDLLSNTKLLICEVGLSINRSTQTLDQLKRMNIGAISLILGGAVGSSYTQLENKKTRYLFQTMMLAGVAIAVFSTYRMQSVSRELRSFDWRLCVS